MELDLVGGHAGPAQRIFGGEEGRGKIIIALADEDPEFIILPQSLPDIGRDVQIGVAVPTIAKPPVPGADAADGHVAAVCMVIEIAPDMGVDRGGIARVAAVEAGGVVEIGRASCRVGGCKYAKSTVVA